MLSDSIFCELFSEGLSYRLCVKEATGSSQGFCEDLSCRVGRWSSVFSAMRLMFSSNAKDLFPSTIFNSKGPSRGGYNDIFSSISKSIEEGFVIENDDEVEGRKGCSLYNEAVSAIPFLYSNDSYTFTLLLRLSARSIRRAGGILYVQFIFG